MNQEFDCQKPECRVYTVQMHWVVCKTGRSLNAFVTHNFVKIKSQLMTFLSIVKNMKTISVWNIKEPNVQLKISQL